MYITIILPGNSRRKSLSPGQRKNPGIFPPFVPVIPVLFFHNFYLYRYITSICIFYILILLFFIESLVVITALLDPPTPFSLSRPHQNSLCLVTSMSAKICRRHWQIIYLRTNPSQHTLHQQPAVSPTLALHNIYYSSTITTSHHGNTLIFLPKCSKSRRGIYPYMHGVRSVSFGR